GLALRARKTGNGRVGRIRELRLSEADVRRPGFVEGHCLARCEYGLGFRETAAPYCNGQITHQRYRHAGRRTARSRAWCGWPDRFESRWPRGRDFAADNREPAGSAQRRCGQGAGNRGWRCAARHGYFQSAGAGRYGGRNWKTTFLGTWGLWPSRSEERRVGKEV